MLKATEIAAGIAFPHAVQVLQLTRTVTDRKTKREHTETVYAITTLSVTDATPAAIAGWLRGHWAIENRLHWVRDVTYAEDHSQVRVGNGPQVMATLRNTAISLLRLDGHDNIAKALRHNARSPHRPGAVGVHHPPLPVTVGTERVGPADWSVDVAAHHHDRRAAGDRLRRQDAARRP
ncbi:MAG TPA: transposase [Mycobacterium sp.]|nr:transposase [Mycobacterium sp.]